MRKACVNPPKRTRLVRYLHDAREAADEPRRLGNADAHDPRAGSFAAAARELRVDPSSVSRCVASLEEELGVRLFQRSTRRIALTEAGAVFAQRLDPLLEELKQAREATVDATGEARGTLRVSVSRTASGCPGSCRCCPRLRRAQAGECTFSSCATRGRSVTSTLLFHRPTACLRTSPLSAAPNSQRSSKTGQRETTGSSRTARDPWPPSGPGTSRRTPLRARDDAIACAQQRQGDQAEAPSSAPDRTAMSTRSATRSTIASVSSSSRFKRRMGAAERGQQRHDPVQPKLLRTCSLAACRAPRPWRRRWLRALA